MPSSTASANTRFRWPLLPLAALIATLPLIHNGYSCGHDFVFHIQSWLDAANQMRHGTLYPHWIFSAAWNSGEPRFLFYPPLSWMLGALLTLSMPIHAAPIVFTWLALTGAALAMDRLAREFVSANTALIASAVYLANPYTLFTAYERTAYGELLAATWLPLLFLAALRKKPSVLSIALPIALLWLTNAPAAVMGCYSFATIIVIRLILLMRSAEASDRTAISSLLTTSIGGALAGLSLAAFYVVPAAYERRYVQISMALIQNMRYQDNFLFGHTPDLPHNEVLRTVSIVAVILLVAAAAMLVAYVRLACKQPSYQRTLVIVLAMLTALIAFLLLPLSSLLWHYVPELAFLQFPWRLLSILAVVLGLATALALEVARLDKLWAIVSMLFVVTVLSQVAIRQFRQGCDILDHAEARQTLFDTHHGMDPTDEYTPNDADNDILRTNDPAYWLAGSPKDFSPRSTPNPAATIVNYDVPPPLEQTISGQIPMHFTINAPKAEFLVLNLRSYPDWRIVLHSAASDSGSLPQLIGRDDGLIAFPVPAGTSTIDISWRRTRDQQLGLGISVLALAAFCILPLRSRKLKTER